MLSVARLALPRQSSMNTRGSYCQRPLGFCPGEQPGQRPPGGTEVSDHPASTHQEPGQHPPQGLLPFSASSSAHPWRLSTCWEPPAAAQAGGRGGTRALEVGPEQRAADSGVLTGRGCWAGLGRQAALTEALVRTRDGWLQAKSCSTTRACLLAAVAAASHQGEPRGGHGGSQPARAGRSRGSQQEGESSPSGVWS